MLTLSMTKETKHERHRLGKRQNADQGARPAMAAVPRIALDGRFETVPSLFVHEKVRSLQIRSHERNVPRMTAASHTDRPHGSDSHRTEDFVPRDDWSGGWYPVPDSNRCYRRERAAS
jgi:hypothetical protein